jgi:PKD repeat protein
MKHATILRKKNKAGNISGAFVISIMLIASILAMAIGPVSADRIPHAIYGYADYCSGGYADGASVSVTSSEGTKTTTVGPAGGWVTGGWQVDVGDPDAWPSGTSFTVTITDGGWQGTASGSVSGSSNNMGTITLDPPTLVATADATPQTVVVSETVNFGGSASGGATPYSWDWDFDDGTPHSNLEDPSHAYASEGTYHALLTVTDTCSNVDTDTVTITVNPALSCDAGGPYTGDTCNPVSFSGSASGGHPPIVSWDWDFGDGTPHSNQQNPAHQYENNGPYTATLIVTDSNSDIDTDTASVTISTDPLVADAGGPYTGTKCNPVSFSGSASGGCSPYTYEWDFGDGGTGSGQNPSHQYDDDDTYTVTVTVTDDNGDIDTDTASVTISTDPLVADAGGPYTGDTNNPVHFSGSASGGCSPYIYEWDFGDGNSGSGQNPTHQYTSEGTYTATLTVTDDTGDIDTDTASVTIDEPSIEADAGGPYYGAVDEPISFSGSVTGGESPYTWHWDFGDGRSDYGKNLEHTYYDAGTYTVTLTVTDDQGSYDSDTTYAYVSGPDPVANANGPYYGTVDCNIQFTGTVLGGESPYTWHWDFGDGDSSTDQNPTHMYDDIGEYAVTLTVTDDDDKVDSDSTTATITIGVSDLGCTGSLSWSNVKGSETVTGSFTVENIGDPCSLLDWEVESYPDFGSDWTFTPNDGDDLTPEDGVVTVEVSVVAPSIKSMVKAALDDQEEEFNGIVKVINKDDPSDYCEIPVSITVPMNIAHNPFIELLRLLMERFPLLNAILSSW